MMCIEQHGFGVVAARWQLANANVDDDQRCSIFQGAEKGAFRQNQVLSMASGDGPRWS